MTSDAVSASATSAEVRDALVAALALDLVGPGPEDVALAEERLRENPSRWYLTGFLVPLDAPEDQRRGKGPEEEIDSAEGADGLDDATEPDRGSANVAFRPSSMGLSVLVAEDLATIAAEVTWGDYRRRRVDPLTAEAPDDPVSAAGEAVSLGGSASPPTTFGAGGAGGEPVDETLPGGSASPPTSFGAGGANGKPVGGTPTLREEAGGTPALREEREETDVEDGRAGSVWVRLPRRSALEIGLGTTGLQHLPLPGGDGLELAVTVRPTTLPTAEGDRRARAVSVFVVNRRRPKPNPRLADAAFAFQVALTLRGPGCFLPRPDVRGLRSEDRDERIGDLHYRDAQDLAVGHNVSVDWPSGPDGCDTVRTTWFPHVAVPRVVPNHDIPCELRMDLLGALPGLAAARAALDPLVEGYRDWIAERRKGLGALVPRRREVAEALLDDAARAALRIADGIAALDDPAVLEAFRIANRAVGAAAARRTAAERKTPLAAVEPPAWYPFQLAFLLLNIRGLATPGHIDRETVDLLFFPTGGGKTEAYLGLAAFTIALRRIRNAGLGSAGLSVLMRYTLRLLTLDQLGRAAAVVCALELEREKAPDTLGTWPIEIALWVGSAATPNQMGRKGDSGPYTARNRVIRFKNDTKNPQPLPIERCPWCGTSFDKESFWLRPDANDPETLDLHCVNRRCDFHHTRRVLPIQAVDEPIYRRLPAFMIATVDKFAGMPWTGAIAKFFGGADRFTKGLGFHGADEPGAGDPLPAPLLPPDLVIQDELHLISGPLGTMAGLYETAIDALASREVEGKRIRPKIVASTATVRQAQAQIRALFDRPTVQIFPPPGPDRHDSYFARMLPANDPGSRRYLAIAAPGGSPKVIFLRAMVTVMAAAETLWKRHAGKAPNPADPYMTAVAYFNALRELGGARRIVEGEVGPRLEKYSRRRRAGEASPRFRDRRIQYEPVELTSRVSTDKVSKAKQALATGFDATEGRVDVALATNMISVGLDISRLGLMLVSGQPKTTAEYIQATSRVGRDPDRPGLVIALLNVSKPRDRSHYERFRAWHQSFYRGVEATSVTPFSPRALDRGLAAVAVAMARLGYAALTPQTKAGAIGGLRTALDGVAEAIARRAEGHVQLSSADAAQLAATVRARAADLLDEWAKLAQAVAEGGGVLGYDGRGVQRRLLREVLDPDLATLPPGERKFRAPRSLRDVEPNVLVAVQTPTGQDINVDSGPAGTP